MACVIVARRSVLAVLADSKVPRRPLVVSHAYYWCWCIGHVRLAGILPRTILIFWDCSRKYSTVVSQTVHPDLD